MWRHGKCLFMCNMALIAELTRAQNFEQFLRMEKMPTTMNSRKMDISRWSNKKNPQITQAKKDILEGNKSRGDT